MNVQNSDTEYEASENETHVGEANDVHNRERRINNRKLKFTLSYRDVKDSIRSFDGSDNYPIERWIADFKEAAIMFEWNEIVFAKKIINQTVHTKRRRYKNMGPVEGCVRRRIFYKS